MPPPAGFQGSLRQQHLGLDAQARRRRRGERAQIGHEAGRRKRPRRAAALDLVPGLALDLSARRALIGRGRAGGAPGFGRRFAGQRSGRGERVCHAARRNAQGGRRIDAGRVRRRPGSVRRAQLRLDQRRQTDAAARRQLQGKLAIVHLLVALPLNAVEEFAARRGRAHGFEHHLHEQRLELLRHRVEIAARIAAGVPAQAGQCREVVVAGCGAVHGLRSPPVARAGRPPVAALPKWR